MEARNILLYLTTIYDGDWDLVMKHISNKDKIDEEKLTEVLKETKSKFVTIVDEDYPKCLKTIYKPPFVLFYYGDLSLISDYKKVLAVVGKRKASSYGIKAVDEIITPIAKKYNVISGMAKGIDTCAHNACIKGKGKTVAVLGTGIDYCYPESNTQLYETLKTNHLIISEYPKEVAFKPNGFPMRNRIIAGLAKGCLIIEADNLSGTQITARCALEYGRDVMAVPYLRDKNSFCNKIISQGAFLVETSNDVDNIMGGEEIRPDFEM